MKFLSMFTGIGGLDLGLERAGLTCVGQVESDPYCRAVLKNHWPDVKRIEDVRDVKGDEFGSLDVIVGGFPCQDVSDAGLRAGISAPRSGLYGEIVRCLRVVRPLRALLENVAALLWRGMGRVLGDMAEIGYDAEWDCLSACAIGAPHCRDRVFITLADAQRDQGKRTQCWTFRRMGWERQPAPWNEHWESALRRLRGVGDGPAYRLEQVSGVRNAVVPACAEIVGRGLLGLGIT